MNKIIRQLAATLTLAVFASEVTAHCDSLEGPVLTEARTALAQNDVTHVLKWVPPADEPAIRAAFARTIAVRSQSKEAAELADTWFFETLVRIHRAGEGAPYTGLTSSAPKEPGIATADRALASGKTEELFSETTDSLRAQLQTKLSRARDLQAHAGHSLEAGRDYVAAYVDYIHFAERLATLAVHASAPAHAGHAH